MYRATIHFSDELENFFLAGKSGAFQDYHFEGSPSLKHVVESLGVPHTEVGYVLVNEAQVSLAYLLQDGDRVEVCSVDQRSAAAGQIQESGPQPGQGTLRSEWGDASFILDNHLGKLAVYLRLLGFDVLYRNDYEDAELAQIASQQNRILLTRDRRLLMRSIVTSGYCVRELLPDRQILEVARRYNLFPAIHPFRRCLRCNGLLLPVNKEEVLDRLQPLTRLYFDEFRICPGCNRVYWKGSHYERMAKLVKRVIEFGGEQREG